MKKVVYIISQVHNAKTFEWIADSNLREAVELRFVLLNPGPSVLEAKLRERGYEVVRIPYHGRRDAMRAFGQLWRLLRRWRPDVVHTHLMAANFLGLGAAWLGRVPSRSYTRHHTVAVYDTPWYAPAYDYLSNQISTRIVATCENGRRVLTDREGVADRKVRVVRFGFRLEDFTEVSPARVETVRCKYRIPVNGPVVGVVSRYMHCKGIVHAVQAFEKLLVRQPQAFLVLANAGKGPATAAIRAALARIPAERYREIEFEDDCAALYRVFDVFVHVPVDPVSEAFGQV